MSAALLVVVLAASQAAGAKPGATREAERLAREATVLTASDPAAALRQARRALALTVEFVPTDFVVAGRKGEVVEDEFQAARDEYKRHRAVLYEAVGGALLAQGQALPASRYLRRAFELEPSPPRGLSLARALVALGRGKEALTVVQRAISGLTGLAPETAQVIAQAADVARLPSAQAEIDRGRLAATVPGVELRDGPLELPPGVKLSTLPTFRLEDAAVNVIYAAEASCRHCSADLDALARHAAQDVRVLALPPGEDQDRALRQVLELYRRPWPLLLGPGLAQRLALPPRSLLIVARGGWTQAVLKAPFGNALPEALAAVARKDVEERVPLANWNRRPVDRTPPSPPPALLPEGLAPGEDAPFPPEFEAAAAAYRAGRPAEALKLIDALEARGDGWLLPPEARIDRALCLARMAQRDAGRRILLRTGDTRFEDEIDRLLETVAQGGK